MASLLCIQDFDCSVWYIKRMWHTRQTAASPKNAIVILSTRVRLQTHTFTFTCKPGRYLSVYELMRHGDRSTSPLSAYGKMGRCLVNAKDHGKGQSKKKKKKGRRFALLQDALRVSKIRSQDSPWFTALLGTTRKETVFYLRWSLLNLLKCGV